VADIKAWFDQLGWLANAIGIAAVPGTLVTLYLRYLHPRLVPTSVARLVGPEVSNTWTEADSKRLARIAIVDDQVEDFPIAELKADGYNVEEFTQVALGNHATLSRFDIVFLDMKGIVKDDPDRGGLKLIAELRNRNRKQKICAVSGQTFDPTATAFFREADDYKKKPLTAQECKMVIDKFLDESLKLSSLVTETDRLLLTVPRAKRRAVVQALRSFSNGSSSDEKARDAIRKAGIARDDSETFITLGRLLHHAARRTA